ncbi:DNA topoisomerase-3 [Paracidovorax anthurii]|uniref:DNA topoisomerase n=2 Tax=Paracidovorax anthurii TaxID=78229 RepID=A0A328ZPV0_9BURK|nr:DNA topoisomerase III [Paracidovorax anthurii]RAR84366.1 DNA topoisomerase-3 [Paracidovorax anthurii]
MTKTLVIAEKPSVAQDIVRALTPVAGKFDKHEDHFENDRYVVTSAVGHLVEIQAPEEFDVKRGKWSFAHLPVIPPYFDLKPVDKTKSRLGAVVRLAKRKDVTDLINACDAGREGELIFRLIEQYAGGAKGALGKPVRRLWLQSMTPQAIRDGFDNLRSDQQMQGLASAARSRSEADWLVGINGTRAMTAFNSRDGGFFLTTVGRVQTPTLSLVVEREEKIRQFVSRDYWEIHAGFHAEAGEYLGKWFDPQWKKKGDDPEARSDRVWSFERAREIADAVRGKAATVTEESKPTTQASPLLFDLTSLQREANGKFGFSAKTTLALAQSLYERHKALTYPRTDSRALPEDYLPVAKDTFGMLATSGMRHLAPYAQQALNDNYVRPTKRIFDNSKVSDHFAIIPTTQAPSGLSEAEQKLYDLVVRRFMAVFFPSAEYMVTTRISQVVGHSFKTEGKVLVKPGWLAIYGKEAANEVEGGKEGDKGQPLVPVRPGEMAHTEYAEPKALKTKPPARYSEATLLGAMESAGKQVEDEELRSAMQEKGLGTPATRAAIIEGLLTEKYMLREGRELIPTAKAFQLMTLLRGLGVEELSRAELTGEWEYKLAQMEKGQLSREAFMQQIAAMTERMVKKAKEYDRDTIPGNYATLATPCPNCGGVVKENYRRYACTGTDGHSAGCGFSFTKSPAGRTFEPAEAEALLRERRIGPLEGFRSKAGWPFTAEVAIVRDEEAGNFKLEFDFGDDRAGEESGELVEFADEPLGPCPVCGAPVHEHGSNYVCSKAVPTAAQPTPSCTFKSGKVILQQPVERAQMAKLLATGKTDLLDKFVSMRTRRAFKAFLAWDKEAGKVNFEFEQRESKYPPRKTAGAASGAAAKKGASRAAKTATSGAKASKPAVKASATAAAKKAPRKASPATGKAPSPALAAVIGTEPVARPEAVKKMWDYIKAHNLQDPKDKRTIVADAKLREVFGKDSVGMFELAGILGKHLGGE